MPVPHISIDELAVALASGALLYDVREPNEFQAGHVEGALPVPLGEVTDRVGDFAHDQPVYIICASGARSGRAVEYLRVNGIDAHNVSGGTIAWIESGKDTISGESSS